MKLAIIGAGGWGTALARMVAMKGNQTYIWAHEADVVGEINERHENSRFLRGVRLPDSLRASSDLGEVLDGAVGAIMAVPSRFTGDVAAQCVRHWTTGTFLLNASKGLDLNTGRTLSQVIQDANPRLEPGQIAVMSGPNHAEEVGRDVLSASVVASRNLEAATFWQQLLNSDNFRVYTNPDLLGVELGGALKNVVALAAGMCDGLGYGDNTRAMLLTRGLAEMARLGSALGASPLTFAGLSGLGDLMATANSRHSRNRWAGEQIGRGRPVAEVLESTPMVVEGIHTVGPAMKLARECQVRMPLAEQVLNLVEGRCSPSDAVRQLMGRDPIQELEAWWTAHVRVAFD